MVEVKMVEVKMVEVKMVEVKIASRGSCDWCGRNWKRKLRVPADPKAANSHGISHLGNSNCSPQLNAQTMRHSTEYTSLVTALK